MRNKWQDRVVTEVRRGFCCLDGTFVRAARRNTLDSNPAHSRYITGYTGDSSAICFNWNGKHGDGFDDANMHFRDQVVAQVIANPEKAPLILLAALFDAITLCSQEAWSIDNRVEEIARLMLNKGGAAYADQYIAGSMRSFDANCATSFIGCRRHVAQMCLARASRELGDAADEDSRHFWEFSVERFELLLKHSVDD